MCGIRIARLSTLKSPERPGGNHPPNINHPLNQRPVPEAIGYLHLIDQSTASVVIWAANVDFRHLKRQTIPLAIVEAGLKGKKVSSDSE